MRTPLALLGLLLPLTASAANIEIYYTVEEDTDGTYLYDMKMVQAVDGYYSFGWVVLGDHGSTCGSDQFAFEGATMVSDSAGPWSGDGGSYGGHEGYAWSNITDRWTPDGLGDYIAWTLRADNVPADGEDILWSYINGGSQTCTPMIQADADADGYWEDFCTFADNSDEDDVDSDGDSIVDVCDACEGDDRTGDTDGDFVCDDIDACEGDDGTGDSDSDGVCDDLDLCEGDDATGDSDGDMVCDDIDLCEGDDLSGDVDGDGFCASDIDGLAIDCDDDNVETYPGAAEVCDGLDNDCDDVVPDDELDADGDGESTCEGDCDDAEAAANTSAVEDCEDGIDNDCDGATDYDDVEECEEPTGDDGGTDSGGTDDGGSDDGATDGEEDDGKGGCSAAPAPSAWWAAALGLVAFGARRRREA